MIFRVSHQCRALLGSDHWCEASVLSVKDEDTGKVEIQFQESFKEPSYRSKLSHQRVREKGATEVVDLLQMKRWGRKESFHTTCGIISEKQVGCWLGQAGNS